MAGLNARCALSINVTSLKLSSNSFEKELGRDAAAAGRSCADPPSLPLGQAV